MRRQLESHLPESAAIETVMNAHRTFIRSSETHRAGFLAPAALIALVAVLGAAALTIDRLWIDNAQVELMTAAEAAALAGARSLATDELLRENTDEERLVNQARSEALRIARQNRVASRPVMLDSAADGDVRIGRLIHDDQSRTIFLETSHQPTTVVVNAEHSRDRQNPVVRLFDGWSGESGADVVARAEATVDHHVVGYRPLYGIPIPALPLAILKSAADDDPTPTWEREIEQRQGSDRFGIDPKTGQVIAQPDGIPEIVLCDFGPPPAAPPSDTGRPGRQPDRQRPSADTAGPDDPQNGTGEEGSRRSSSPPAERKRNVYAFALNRRASTADIARQFHSGWTAGDLPSGTEVLRIDRGPHVFPALNTLGGAITDALRAVTGQQRIVLLFDGVSVGRGTARVNCVSAVAGRVMSVDTAAGNGCRIVFQPTVLTTRTAVLSRETVTQGPPDRFVNTYICKLQLTQ